MYTRKSTAWYVEPRWATQAHFNEQVIAVATELDQFQGHVAQADADLEAQLAGVTEKLIDVLDQLTSPRQHVCPADATAGIDYVAFEERFRGSAEVKDAQRDYVGRFASSTAGGPVVDIGCGRGEMFELLRRPGSRRSASTPTTGCSPTVGAGARRGARRRHRVAAGRGDASLRGIFLAQVVEHLAPRPGRADGRRRARSPPEARSSSRRSIPGRSTRRRTTSGPTSATCDRCIRRPSHSSSSRPGSPRSVRSGVTGTSSPTWMRRRCRPLARRGQ